MSFKSDKRDFLAKKDKSKQGAIDNGILPLINAINALPDYMTTSSCAGRTVLINLYGERKNQSKWIYKSHEPPESGAELMEALRSENLKGTTYLKFEPFIVHVRCKTIEAAESMLKLARDSGLKKAGIIGISRTHVLELEGNDRLETPVATAKIQISEEYINYLIKEIKKKQKSNEKKIKKFRELLISLPG